jgi:PAS domain S-box-containing protein
MIMEKKISSEILKLTTSLISASSIDAVFNLAIQGILEIPKLEGCGIYKIDNDLAMAVLERHRGLDSEFTLKVEYLPLSLNIFKNDYNVEELLEFSSSSEDDIYFGKKIYFYQIKRRDQLLGLILFTIDKNSHLDTLQKNSILYFSDVIASVLFKLKEVESLIISSELSRGIVNSAPIGILFIDQEGIVIFENPAMTSIIKLHNPNEPSLVGKKIYNISSTNREQFIEAIKVLLTGDSIYGLELEYEDNRKNQRTLEFHGAPRFGSAGEVIGAVMMCLDLTNYKMVENQLRQAQKMEAIGTLAGGIAHDFNNLLTGIMGNVELAILKMKTKGNISENLESIYNSSKRAAELTSQLLAFGRRRMEQPKALDIRKSVDDALKILKRTIDPLIDIKLVFRGQNHTIYADSGQMSQMLVNLLLNACDAMPSGGKITLVTENVYVDKDYRLTNSEAKQGHYCKLSITDTGIGIPEENLKKIFEPFFTTKEQDKGTGLGLAMVYGIVKGHQGWIEVNSKAGSGATFSVFLPLSDAEIEDYVEEEPITLVGGQETILLVDDEIEVRNLGKELLESFGYEVILACNGSEAIEIYNNKLANINLVILDLSMPKKSGRETLKELLEINKEVKVIVSSGYDKGGPVMGLLKMGAKSFVQKPYKIDKMLQEVRKVLDAKLEK